jgi:hypothetical protein
MDRHFSSLYRGRNRDCTLDPTYRRCAMDRTQPEIWIGSSSKKMVRGVKSKNARFAISEFLLRLPGVCSTIKQTSHRELKDAAVMFLL